MTEDEFDPLPADMMRARLDILDAAVGRLADDDYCHVPLAVLQRRLALIRGTHVETHLEEAADLFIAAVRDALTDAGDPELGWKYLDEHGRMAAYAAAVAHPYHVSTFPDWRAHNGVAVGFQSEAEARRFASLRPENLIDLVAKGRGVIAARRLIPHPDDPNADTWRAFDDFPDTRGKSTMMARYKIELQDQSGWSDDGLGDPDQNSFLTREAAEAMIEELRGLDEYGDGFRAATFRVVPALLVPAPAYWPRTAARLESLRSEIEAEHPEWFDGRTDDAGGIDHD